MIQCWQIRWDRSTTCRTTYDVIQAVETKLIFPKNKNVAVSYVRLLLNDTTLREHQYQMGLADTKICESNDGTEYSYHFFFQCSSSCVCFSHMISQKVAQLSLTNPRSSPQRITTNGKILKQSRDHNHALFVGDMSSCC